MTKLGDVARLMYGASLAATSRRSGVVPVYGSNGIVGAHDTALTEGPGLVIGRKGSIGEVTLVPGPFWPIDTTYYIDASSARCDLKWLSYLLRSLNLRRLNKATGVPGLDREDVHRLEVRVPPLKEQSSLAGRLERLLLDVEAVRASCEAQEVAGSDLRRALLDAEFGGTAPLVAGGTGLKEGAPCRVPLRSLARLESGHTPSRRHPEWWGGDVPWLALPDIRKLHGKVAYTTTENTNDLGLANSSARLLPVNTVCVSRTASIGFVTLLGRPMATSQDFCNWVCNPDQLDAEFLMYAFMASQDHLRELGSGAVHKTIYMPTIESFHLCAPPLAEQRRIAHRLRERLAAAETLQASLRAQLAEVERLPQRILAAAFDA